MSNPPLAESPIILIGGVGIEGGTGLEVLLPIYFTRTLSALLSSTTTGGRTTSGGVGLLKLISFMISI